MNIISTIPVINLAEIDFSDQGIEKSSRYQSVVKDFYDAYHHYGFSYLINHGIDQQLIDQTFAASRSFHALPAEEKQKVALDQNHRGFIAMNTSTDVNSKFADVSRPNQSESFIILREDGDDSNPVRSKRYLAGKNQWPDLPNFKQTLIKYQTELSILANHLTAIAARSLGAAPADLHQHFDPPTTWLRLLHYPSQTQLRPDDLFGSAPHTDFGCLTILAQDNVGGLQVRAPFENQNKDIKSQDCDRWIDVPYLEGSFIVNVGDMLHRWSNGLLRSTPHRVINPSGKE